MLTVDVLPLLHRTGDELDRPFEFKLFKQSFVCFKVKNCTVSPRESNLNNGNRPSVTASTMHGSSPFIKAFDKPFNVCFVFNHFFHWN